MSDKFEKWIQESSPSVEINENSKEIHLAVLKQRLREREKQHVNRQTRMRRSGVVVVALMIVIAGGNVAELGSDGFDYKIVESDLVSETQQLEVGHRQSAITGPASMNSDTLRDLEVEMEYSQGIPVSVEAIGIHGDESWSINFEYDVNGIRQTGGRMVKDRPSNPTMDHLRFAESELELVLKMITKGMLHPVATRKETVEGYSFLIKSFQVQSEQLGLIIYQKGLLIH